MEKLFKQIGDEIREYTSEEYAQNELDKQEALKNAQVLAQAEAKRQSALAKLAALGLEEDDLKALGL